MKNKIILMKMPVLILFLLAIFLCATWNEELIISFYNKPVIEYDLPPKLIKDINELRKIYGESIELSYDKSENDMLYVQSNKWSANYIADANTKQYKIKALFLYAKNEFCLGIKAKMNEFQIINIFGNSYKRIILKMRRGISYQVKNTNDYIVFCFDLHEDILEEIRIIYN